MPFVESWKTPRNVESIYIGGGSWYYPGKTPTKDQMRALFLIEAREFVDKIRAGDPEITRFFERSVPGSRAEWDDYLMKSGRRPLALNVNRVRNGDYVYTPEDRDFLIKQLYKYDFTQLFGGSLAPFPGPRFAFTPDEYKIFDGIVPQKFIADFNRKYARVATATPENSAKDINAEAVADREALIGYINAYYDNIIKKTASSPGADLFAAGARNKRDEMLNEIPTLKDMVNVRKKRIDLAVRISKMNPIKKKVAEKWLEKDPRAWNRNDGFKKMFQTKEEKEKNKYYY